MDNRFKRQGTNERNETQFPLQSSHKARQSLFDSLKKVLSNSAHTHSIQKVLSSECWGNNGEQHKLVLALILVRRVENKQINNK